MNGSQPNLSVEDLRKQREVLLQGLRRANTAALATLSVVVGLAIASIYAAFRAEQNAQKAHEASAQADQQRARAEEELWKSCLAQARALRLSGAVGRRSEILEAVAAGARIRPSLALRNEAIAALALTDLRDSGRFQAFPTNTATATFDPDLEHYACGDNRGIICVYRMTDNQETLRLPGPAARVAKLVFSPDGQYLAAGHANGELWVWKLSTQTASLKIQRAIELCDFSANSLRLALISADGAFICYDLTSGQELNRLALETRPSLIRLHPFESVVAVAMGREVRILNWKTGQLLKKFAHSDVVPALAWRADARLLAAGTRDGRVYVWDVESGQPQVLIGHTAGVFDVTFNPRGDLLASAAYDATTRLWEPSAGSLVLATQRGYASRFSRDGRKLGYWGSSGIGYWEMLDGQGFQVLACPGGSDRNIWSVEVSSNKQWLAVMKADGLRIIDRTRLKQLAFVPLDRARTAHIHPDGKTIVTTSGDGIAVWPMTYDPAGATNSVTLGPPQWIKLAKATGIASSHLSYDGRHVTVGINEKDWVLVDLADPARTVRFENYFSPGVAALSPDRKWVATGTFHGYRKTRIWDASTGKPVHDLADRSASVVFSPDNRLLISCTGEAYYFWEVGSWKLLDRLPTDSIGELPSAAVFTPDGRVMAIAKARRFMQLLDPITRKEFASLVPPDPQRINRPAFSTDGTLLAVATPLGIHLWDLALIRRELRALGLDWSPDGSGFEGSSIDRPLLVANNAAQGQVRSGASRLPWAWRELNPLVFFAFAGVVAAILFAVFALRRHQKLIEGYEQIDNLVNQRNRELAVAQSEIMYSQKMTALGTLAAGIAHDFNNLLSVIRMSNTLIGRDAPDHADIQENVGAIEQAVHQGKSVVHSMLGYSRDTSKDGGTYSVAELVEDAVALLTKQFLSGITLSLELDRSLPDVSGSRGRLEQILLNLIVNASEAMTGKGSLLLAVRLQADAPSARVLQPRPAERYVELSVTDSGPGIDPQILDRIFEPFFTTKVAGATPGTGLGLSMAYSIAQQDGLGISVDSTLGKGTTFRIAVPVE